MRRAYCARAHGIVKSIAASEISSDSAQSMIKDELLLSDIILPVLKEREDEKERNAILELYARKLYHTEDIKNVVFNAKDNLLKVDFTPKQDSNVLISSAPLSSMLDLSRMVSSTSLSQLSECSDQEEEVSPASPPGRSALFSVVDSLNDIEVGGSEIFEKLLSCFSQSSEDVSPNGPKNNLYIFVLRNDGGTDMDKLAEQLENTLSHYSDLFRSADLRRVSVIVPSEVPTEENVVGHFMPAKFTFRAQLDFKEDTLFRHIDPTHAHHLELVRLAKNFGVKGLNSHQTQAATV